MQRVPSVFTTYAHACVQCSKGTKDAPLQRCGGCQRVYYCGSACQKANWPKHKAICNALKTLETKHGEELRKPFQLLGRFSGQGVGMAELADDCINSVAEIEMRVLSKLLRRELRVDERNLVGWQPRCLACGRSNLLLRVEASSGSKAKPPALKGCGDCLLVFACNDTHWNAVESKHKDLPCQDSIDGKSQCEMNHMVLQDLRFSQFMAGAEAGAFRWAPERTVAKWCSLKDVDWNDYGPALKEEFGGTPASDSMLEPMLRAVTEGMSMPLTILWALEVLNGEDLAWTRKDALNIHILGAAEKEIENANIFEEILHRVPEVKTLNLMFIGPELAGVTGPQTVVTPMETCPDCSRRGRKRVHQYHGKTYDAFVRAHGGVGFANPDLAVAFNSGSSQEVTHLWRPTLKLLVDRHIPTVFTSYNHDEARAEGRLLESAGAALVPSLGPRRNPWGSLMMKTEPNRITGFYAVNGWLSGGFR